MKWAQMGSGDEDHAIGGEQEHRWIQDFLNKVRLCIMNPSSSVVFTDVNQVNFIKKFLTDYKNNAGEYIFEGTWGDNVRIGQFPALTGSANSSMRGQGGFPEEAFLQGSNVFNGILYKLGNIIYPPLDPVYHSPGEV